MPIRIKRAYDAPAKTDGERILVDRLWPRGLKKEKAAISEWYKDIAPSNELRQWFRHEPGKWPEFKKSYKKELASKKELVSALAGKARRETVTFVFAAKDEEHNNAVVLKEYVEKRT